MAESMPATRAGRASPVVGRDEERAAVLAALARPPAVVLVEGEAGVGKTRLVREAASAFEEGGGRVLSGVCRTVDEPLPFEPVLDALRTAGDWLPAPDALNPQTGLLRAFLPELGDRLPPGPRPPQGDGGRVGRFHLLGAVRSALDAAGPAMLAVDDVHLADRTTRDLLTFLARDPPSRLGLVLAYRSDAVPGGHPVLDVARLHPAGAEATVVHLAPLTSGDVQLLAGHVLGDRATRSVGRALFERSEGLPLILAEDLRAAARSASRGEALPDRLRRAPPPAGLRVLVAERFAGLSPGARSVAEAAAVLAEAAPQSLIARLAGLDDGPGAAALTEALEAGLLQESGPDRYRFRHSLAGRVVYDRIPGPRRRQMHLRAVEALDALAEPPLVQIARHTRQLGEHQAWLARALPAADEAAAAGDDRTAMEILHDVLADPALEPGTRARAALSMSGVLLAAGRVASDGADYRTTVSALRRLMADPQLPRPARGEIRLSLGRFMIDQTLDQAGMREMRRALGELDSRPDLAGRAMAGMALRAGDQPVSEDLDWMRRAEETVGVSKDPEARAAVHSSKITLWAMTGDPEVWELVDRLPRESASPATLKQAAQTLFNVASLALDLGHDERAAVLLEESVDLAERSGRPLLDFWNRWLHMELDWYAGRWAGLEARYAALEAENPDMPMLDVGIALPCGRLAAARGEWKRAEEHFRTVTARRDSFDNPIGIPAAVGLARLALARGETDAAWDCIGPAVERQRRKDVWVWANGLVPAAVRTLLGRGRRDQAEQLSQAMQDGLADRDSPAASAELQLCLGHLAETADPGRGAQHFDRARLIYQVIGRPYDGAQAAEYAVRATAATAPHDAARRLAEIIHTYDRLGAESDAARCQQTLRELSTRRHAHPGRRGYGSALSPRELQVARLLAGGSGNRAIAEALFLSPRTVENHVARVLKKLGVTRDGVADALAHVER